MYLLPTRLLEQMPTLHQFPDREQISCRILRSQDGSNKKIYNKYSQTCSMKLHLRPRKRWPDKTSVLLKDVQ
jgi:hypothetical protein